MVHNYRSRVGKTIWQFRVERGWTQETLADRAGLHPTYIGGVERGERNLGLDNILKIAKALSKHPSALFSAIPKSEGSR